MVHTFTRAVIHRHLPCFPCFCVQVFSKDDLIRTRLFSDDDTVEMDLNTIATMFVAQHMQALQTNCYRVCLKDISTYAASIVLKNPAYNHVPSKVLTAQVISLFNEKGVVLNEQGFFQSFADTEGTVDPPSLLGEKVRSSVLRGSSTCSNPPLPTWQCEICTLINDENVCISNGYSCVQV